MKIRSNVAYDDDDDDDNDDNNGDDDDDDDDDDDHGDDNDVYDNASNSAMPSHLLKFLSFLFMWQLLFNITERALKVLLRFLKYVILTLGLAF